MTKTRNTLGFIGCGTLGSALIDGILTSGVCSSDRMYAYDKCAERLETFPQIHRCNRVEQVVSCAEILFLAVKPQDVVGALRDVDLQGRLLVSAVAGLQSAALRRAAPTCGRVLRIMPNLAVRLCESATAYGVPNELTAQELEDILAVLSALGAVQPVPEEHMDVATAVCGSGPAFFAYFMQAMADAAVREGVPFENAIKLVMQTGLSANALLTGRSQDPKTLIEAVSSRGGTTEAGIRSFECNDVANEIGSAVHAAVQRASELSDIIEKELRS